MANRNQLSYGSQGSDVTELQKLLNQNGYNLDVDGIYGTNTQNAVKEYQQKNGLDVDGIVGNNTWGALTGANAGKSGSSGSSSGTAGSSGFQYQPYKQSDTVTQAYEMLQQQLGSKPGAYQSQWQSQLNDVMQKILNREKFTYDLNGDALYQQYKDQYMNQGKMAMMDTMGQAAALTGGYGNSYAQSVGQQAYQGYLQQLNDKVPELYQLAMNQYQMEGDQLLNQYGILGAQEEQDYGRHRDQVADWQSERDRLQNQYYTERDYDYGRWADDRDFGYGQYIDNRNYDYQVGRDAVADSQWQKEFDEAVRQFNFANKLGEFAPVASSGGGGGGWGPSNTGPETETETEPEPESHGDGKINKSNYASWGMGEWNEYFAHINNTEGESAAMDELDTFNRQGVIPQVYVAAASSGAQGNRGSYLPKGH